MSKSKPVEVAEEEQVDNLKKYPNFDEPQEYQELLNVAKKRFLNRRAVINGGDNIYNITENELKLLSPLGDKKLYLTSDTELYNIKKDIIKKTVSKIMMDEDANKEDYEVKRMKALLHFTDNIIPLKNYNFNEKTKEEQKEYVDNLFKIIVFRFYCLCREELIRKTTIKYYEQNILKLGKVEDLTKFYGTNKYNDALNAYVTKTSVPQKGFANLTADIKDMLNAMAIIVNESKPITDENYLLDLYTTINCDNKKSTIQNIAISMFTNIPEKLEMLKEERAEQEAKASQGKK